MVGMEGVPVIDPALLYTVCKRWDASVCKVSLVIKSVHNQMARHKTKKHL